MQINDIHIFVGHICTLNLICVVFSDVVSVSSIVYFHISFFLIHDKKLNIVVDVQIIHILLGCVNLTVTLNLWRPLLPFSKIQILITVIVKFLVSFEVR